MLEFLQSLTEVHAALFVSVLALVVSLRSASIAEKSRRFTEEAHRHAERAKIYEKRTEILSEIDRQHARFGSLLLLTAEKILLFQKNPWLFEHYPSEYARLKQNLEGVESIRSRYEEQRKISELVDENAEYSGLEVSLAEIRRLTIHVDEDITKETHHLNEIKRVIENNAG